MKIFLKSLKTCSNQVNSNNLKFSTLFYKIVLSFKS